MSTNYWKIGLDSFNAGDSPITGIQKIWDAMQPPTSLATLATVVGSLWADTYWATTKMDVNRLASDIEAGIGINLADAQKAAQFAFDRWAGLLVRGNPTDGGSIPKSDPVTSSPDVVVNSEVALTVEQLVEQWSDSIYTPQLGLKNNTYGRCQSYGIQVPITKPVLRMYFSDAGFSPPPMSWIQMFTSDSSADTSPFETRQGSKTLAPGDRAANSESFYFTPPAAGHYCLITVAGTEFFTNNPLSNLGGNWNTQEWVYHNGAAGWRNVDVSPTSMAALKFYNQDGRAERFGFEAHCHKVPEGTEVSLECRDERLAYPLQGSGKCAKAYEVVTAEGEIPPYFTGDLSVRFKTPNGKPLPRGASVDVRKFWHLSPGHPHYHQAVDQLADTRALALHAPVRIPMGNFTFIGPSK
jgi:hypothetical protein